jgi:hypothetical protein
MSAAEEASANTPRLRVPSQESTITGPDPFQLLVSGYVIGALLHGGLDLSLISVEATTNDRRSSFTVESKISRKRLHISVREEIEPR